MRPLAIGVSGLSLGGVANPAGSAATDSVFGKAGAAFGATVAAYRWSAAADANDDGVLDATATFAQLSGGGLAAGFNATVTLSPAAASQTRPAAPWAASATAASVASAAAASPSAA